MALAITERANEIRQLAARGEFADARQALVDFADALEKANLPQAAGVAAQLPLLARTLEVLESIDVVRNLLRAGNSEAAAEASSRILERLTDEDYAQLGISGAAITLLSRASELARSGNENAEFAAFVEFLGGEVNELQQRRFDEPFRRMLKEPASRTSASMASTLGDLLDRKPWRSGLQPAVEPEISAQPRSQSAARVPTIDQPGGPGQAPVLGKILIEQEPRAQAPQTQTSGAGAESDVFDVIGRAALRHWYVVLGTALVFSLLGYLVAVASPRKYQAAAVLQKSQPSPLRAPITNQTSSFAPTMPREAVAEMTRMLSFYQDVEKKLATSGWAPKSGPQAGQKQSTMPVTMDDVGAALKVTVKDTGGGSYMIEFAAIHADENTARALADTSAGVFQEKYRDTLVREPQANLDDYKKRGQELQKELDAIALERMKEFYVAADSEAVGLTTSERIRLLMSKLSTARTELDNAKLAVASTKLEIQDFSDQLRETEPTIPNPRAGTGNPQLDAVYSKWQQVTDELLDLDRKRADFGAKHPIHDRINDLRAQRAELQRRIEELEEETGVRRNTIQNPSYVTAGLRVKEAKAKLGAAELAQTRWSEEATRIETELNALREKYIASENLRGRESELSDQLKRNAAVQEDLKGVIATSDRELQVVQSALRASPIEPKVLVGIAVGLVLGLLVGVVISIAMLRRRKLGEVSA